MEDVCPKTLKHFALFSDISEQQRIQLCGVGKLIELDAGVSLFNVEDDDAFEWFLLEGSVHLLARDGRANDIAAHSPQAQAPLARLRPRQFSAVTVSPVSLLQFDHKALSSFFSHDAEYVNHEGEYNFSDKDILGNFHEALENHMLALPSLPRVGSQIRQRLDEEDLSLDELRRLVGNDPALSVKLMRAASSALYSNGQGICTLKDAVARLGLKTAKKLILSFCVRELFRQESPVLLRLMQESWQQSRQIAALCHVLAEECEGADPECAMLCGLFSNVGNIPIIMIFDAHPQESKHITQLCKLPLKITTHCSVALLRHWHFDPLLSESIAQAADWSYDSAGDQSALSLYSNILIIARQHYYLAHSDWSGKCPAVSAIPASGNLKCGPLDPQLSMQIMAKSEAYLKQLDRLLPS